MTYVGLSCIHPPGDSDAARSDRARRIKRYGAATRADPDAFAAFYRRYERLILGYLLRRTRNLRLPRTCRLAPSS
jgi:hypothetical protein